MRKRNRTKPFTAEEVWQAMQKESPRFRLTKREAASLARGLNQAKQGKLIEIDFREKR